MLENTATTSLYAQILISDYFLHLACSPLEFIKSSSSKDISTESQQFVGRKTEEINVASLTERVNNAQSQVSNLE